MGLSILSSLSRPISSMAMPGLPFYHPFPCPIHLLQAVPVSPLSAFFVTVSGNSCLPLRTHCPSLVVVLTAVLLDVLVSMIPKSSQSMRPIMSSPRTFYCMSFPFPLEISITHLSPPQTPTRLQQSSISKFLALICSSSFHSVPDCVPFSVLCGSLFVIPVFHTQSSIFSFSFHLFSLLPFSAMLSEIT